MNGEEASMYKACVVDDEDGRILGELHGHRASRFVHGIAHPREDVPIPQVVLRYPGVHGRLDKGSRSHVSEESLDVIHVWR